MFRRDGENVIEVLPNAVCMERTDEKSEGKSSQVGVVVKVPTNLKSAIPRYDVRCAGKVRC